MLRHKDKIKSHLCPPLPPLSLMGVGGWEMGAPLCCSLLLTLFPCPSMVLSMGCTMDVCSALVHHGLQGISALVPGAPPLPPAPSLTSVSSLVLLTLSQPTNSLSVWCFLSLLKYVFPAWLVGSAVPCDRSVGAGCGWHGEPLASSHRGHLWSPPAANTLTPMPHTYAQVVMQLN